MIGSFGGTVILIAALAATGLGLCFVLTGRLSGRAGLARSGGRLVVGALAGLLGLGIIGWTTARRGVVPLGGEISFCGIDDPLPAGVVV